MNKINARGKLASAMQFETLQKTNASPKKAKISQIKSPNNKESLKIANEKATAKPPKEAKNTIKSVLSNGLNYFKEVAKKAEEDRANGVKPIQGAKNLWSQLSTQVDKIGQKAQKGILDDLVTQGSILVSDSIKGTEVGGVLDDILGTGSELGSAASGTEAAISNTAASQVSSATATTEAAEAIASTGTVNVANKVMGGVGAAYSLYQIYDTFGKSSPVEGAMNGATVGAYAGSFFGPIGTVVGGAIGAVVGAGLGLINSRKHPDTILRDQLKAGLSEASFLDKDKNIALADGTLYSLNNRSQDKLVSQDGTDRYAYQVDYSNPLTEKAIALTQPLAEIFTGGHDKLKVDLIGYLVNAATSNASSEAEVAANILSFYEQSKLTTDDLAGNLKKLHDTNKISDEELSVYANDLTNLLTSRTSQATQTTESGPANEELMAA